MPREEATGVFVVIRERASPLLEGQTVGGPGAMLVLPGVRLFWGGVYVLLSVRSTKLLNGIRILPSEAVHFKIAHQRGSS